MQRKNFYKIFVIGGSLLISFCYPITTMATDKSFKELCLEYQNLINNPDPQPGSDNEEGAETSVKPNSLFTALFRKYPGSNCQTLWERVSRTTRLELDNSNEDYIKEDDNAGETSLLPLKTHKRLSTIKLRYLQVSTLSGIEHLTKRLINLDLDGNPLVDITALKDMKRLTKISMKDLSLGGDFPIGFLMPLQNIPRIMKLETDWGNATPDSCPINSKSEPLAQKCQGHYPFYPLCRSCTDHNIGPVCLTVNVLRSKLRITGDTGNTCREYAAKLFELKELSLVAREISDLSPLKELYRLESLNLENNHIADYDVLKKLTALKELNIKGNPATSLIPLGPLKALHSLEADKDVIDLGSCPKDQTSEELKKFCESLDKPPFVTDCTAALEGSQSERKLTYEKLTGYYSVSNCEALWDALKNVTRLDLSNKSLFLKNIDFVAFLNKTGPNESGLRTLSLDGNEITDLSSIIKLKNLVDLSLENNADLTDLTPLANANLRDLKKLNIKGTKVYDIRALANNPNLDDTSLSIDWDKIGGARCPLRAKSQFIADKCFAKIPFINLCIAADIKPEVKKTITILKGLAEKDDCVEAFESLNKMDAIDLSGKEISSLEPLYGLINITILNLENNQIADLSPIGELTNLVVLNIRNNSVSDLSPVKNLVTLKNLDIRDNPIEDLRPLKMINFDTITADWTKPKIEGNKTINKDFCPPDAVSRALVTGCMSVPAPKEIPFVASCKKAHLSANKGDSEFFLALKKRFHPKARSCHDLWEAVKNITSLNLERTYLTSINGMETMENLTEINLAENDITDISPLTNLKKLEKVDLSGNDNLIAATALSNLNSLKSLNIENTSINSLLSLEGLAMISKIYLEKEKIKSINCPYKAASSELRKICHDIIPFLYHCYNRSNPGAYNTVNKISQKYNIADCNKLYKAIGQQDEINLTNSNISDLTPLVGFNRLTKLVLARNNITDISPLRSMHNLTILDLSDNAISGISVVRNMRSLTELNLSGNNIEFLGPLANLDELESLDLSHNLIKDTDSVKNLDSLSYLNLSHNHIGNIDAIAEMKGLSRIYLANNRIVKVPIFLSSRRIKALSIGSNQVENLENLKQMVGLIYFDASGNEALKGDNCPVTSDYPQAITDFCSQNN